MVRTRPARLAATLAVAGLSVAACGGSSGPADAVSPAEQSAAGTITVVASTNVYGSIAELIGGDHVQVTSLISDPGQDPHSYEANTQNQLALSKAALVIENGGGYDDFVDTMRKASKNGHVTVLNAVQISGKQAPAAGQLNEHVWYDFATITKVADQIASSLGAIDPADAAQFTQAAAEFTAQVQPLVATEASIKSKHAGVGVAITEPVPLYLLQACGLSDKTPAKFSEAIEAGEDVSPGVLSDTLKLFSDKQVKALVYNEQTSGPITEQVKKAAADAGVGVVPVTETLPSGKSYAQWMSDQLQALQSALDAA